VNQVYGVILVNIRTVEVQVNLLYLYSESVAEFGVVGVVVYRNV
jgi:hypothetical protein